MNTEEILIPTEENPTPTEENPTSENPILAESSESSELSESSDSSELSESSESSEEVAPEPTERQLETAQLAASASPDGSLSVTMIGMQGFMRIEEAEAKAYDAYLRGRTEATAASSSDLLPLRESVWD